VSKAAAGGATELAKHEQGLESEREKRVGVSKRMPTVSKWTEALACWRRVSIPALY